VEILTNCPQEPGAFADDQIVGEPPYCWCGDRWRCEDGHVGSVYCDSETPIQLEWGGLATADVDLPA
jgi:hypothetical protein